MDENLRLSVTNCTVVSLEEAAKRSISLVTEVELIFDTGKLIEEDFDPNSSQFLDDIEEQVQSNENITVTYIKSEFGKLM